MNWEDKLDELLEKEHGLTSWEIDFIEALESLRGGRLTEKQEEKLDQIWQRVCNA